MWRKSLAGPGRAALCCLWLAAASTGQAQSTNELNTLIFDPVPLEAELREDGSYELQLLPVPQGKARPRNLQADHRPLNAPYGPLPASQEAFSLNREVVGSDNSPNVEASIRRYQESINQMEAEGGPYDQRKSQELLSLATLQKQVDDFPGALDSLNQAWHVTRVNHGLYSLEQSAILEEMIDTLLVMGDLVEADSMQEYLFQLYQKTHGPDSLEVLPALEKLADWHLFAYKTRLDRLVVNGSSRNGISYAESLRAGRLVTVQHIYSNAIQILLNNFGPSDPRLPNLEARLAASNYLFASTFSQQSLNTLGPSPTSTLPQTFVPGTVNFSAMGYRQGTDALERRLSYLQTEDQAPDPLAMARAHVDLGDWHLVFRKRGDAQRHYQAAYELMAEHDVLEAGLPQLLDTRLPVEIPSFAELPYSRRLMGIDPDRKLNYQGHVDVALTINKLGNAEKIEVIGASQENRSIESRLLRHLRRSNFRPAHAPDGSLREEDKTYFVRYYYNYSSSQPQQPEPSITTTASTD